MPTNPALVPIETAVNATDASLAQAKIAVAGAIASAQAAVDDAIAKFSTVKTEVTALKSYFPDIVDPYEPVNVAGTGAEAGFTFKHVAGPDGTKHPFAGFMARYPKQDGDIKKLLGYETNYAMWFASRAPLLQYVLWADNQLHPGYLFADNGRLCVSELKSAVAAGEIPVIAVPFDPDQLQYPNIATTDTATGKVTYKADPRNIGPFSLMQLAQGPSGPAANYFTQLTTFIKRLVAPVISGGGGMTKAYFRLAWEMTGNWFRDRAAAGQGGWWLLAFNQIAALIKSIMPGALMIWNMAREVSGGMAPMNDTLWISSADAATINAAGVGLSVTAGTPINADVLGIDPYNACWLSLSKTTNAMTQAQIDTVLAYRWKNEGGVWLDRLEAAADKLGVPLCVPEWGTGYADPIGVPVDSAGKPQWLNGKVGGDDYFYIEQMYARLLKWRKAGKLVFACYWERRAGDGHTVLSFAKSVSFRTGKSTSTTTNRDLKERAAQKFVECFGIPTATA